MKLTNKTVLLIILLVAVFLRFYNFFELPFTHDEFSAFFRLQFDSFSELIEKGVKVDGHPAGIQVFLYYWTKLFGQQEWVVKLPFAIFGVSAVYLIYLIGKKWFNETVGLISSAYLASIQFAVMYSQMARPYISGLFFSLLMIYYWGNVVKSPEKDFWKNSILFIVSASLCAYNHHFSLLFAAIVATSGLFFIRREFLIKYLLSCLSIFVLYIPHLNIFFYQLNIGGVEGWLAKPANDFILKFVYYIFNYSIPVVVLTLLVVLFGLRDFRKNDAKARLIILSFVWFILPFLVGFFYSRYVNAVLQFSVLIFSFPLLFFVLFGYMKEKAAKVNLLLVTLILSTCTLTLIFSRKHYSLFFNSVYSQVLTDCECFKKERDSTIFIIESHPKISDYYLTKLDIDTSGIDFFNKSLDIKELKKFLVQEHKNHNNLFLGCLSSIQPNIVPLIKDYYPTIEAQKNYFGGTTYLFSKDENKTEKTISYVSFDEAISDNWTSIDTMRIISLKGQEGNNGYFIFSENEWGPTLTLPLKDVILNKNNFIDISVDAKSTESFGDVVLVASLETESEAIYWSGTDFSTYHIDNGTMPEWQRFHHSV
ncbi:MAG: glycosyltransferase family 39 protein, partial [Bacilli bacterium]